VIVGAATASQKGRKEGRKKKKLEHRFENSKRVAVRALHGCCHAA